jgi:hypothetical protein
MNYLALGADLDENLKPFWFLKPGDSGAPLRRMRELRMVLLKAWNRVWLETSPGGWNYLSTWLEAQLSPTYAEGDKKFGGYTEARGRFNSVEEALNCARELIAKADELPLEWHPIRGSQKPAWLKPAPVGRLA